MGMTAAYTTAIAAHGASLVTHFGLVDETGTELTGGTYARIANTPTATTGTWRPSTDLTFEVPAGVTVGGWRAYSALTAGTNYGGEDLTQEAYAAAGQYVLEGASTSVAHTV